MVKCHFPWPLGSDKIPVAVRLFAQFSFSYPEEPLQPPQTYSVYGNGLWRQELFKRLLQSLIELSPHGSEERSLLESLSKHVQAKIAVDDRQLAMAQGG